MLNQTTIFGIISLINFLTCIFIGAFLLIKNPRNPINITYCIFDFCIAFYAFFYFLWQSSNDPAWGILFFKWCIVGVVLINSAFVHFTFVILSIAKKFKWQLFVAHLLNAFFCYGALFLFYSDWKIKYTYGLWPIPSTIFHFYISWWFFQVIYCFFLIHTRGILKSEGKEKRQYQWIFWATLIAYAGGATNWLVWYGINFPPYLNSGIAIYTIVLAYAIFRHQLLDIEIIIKKTLVFAGLLTMAMFVVSIVSTTTKGFIGQYITISENISTLISVLIALGLYKPTHIFLVAITDKFLFQKKSEIKVILNRLSERVITIADIEQIGKTILSTLEETLRVELGMIFLQNKKLGNYRVLEHFGMTGDELNASIRTLLEDPSIIDYFFNQGTMILNLDHPEKRIGLPQAVSNWLKTSKSRVCIPLFINEEQFGLMMLGKKKSDQEFTQEEMDFFPTIASQAALAIRNGRLIETVVEEREAKVKAQHEAKRAHYAKMVAHEIKNKLVSVRMPGHFLLTLYAPNLRDIHDRFYKDKAPQAVDKKYLQICDKLEHMGKELQEISTEIYVIAKTAQYDLEEDKEVLETISFHLVWESAIQESGVQGIQFDVEMPDGFKGDANPTLLKGVLVNLLTNARDAMAQQADNKRIELKCRYDEIDSCRVAYFEFKDNGPGIPKEIQEKIFMNGFSTKPKPQHVDYRSSGHGYGLYTCKEHIESWHHGKIWIESEPGKGAKFIFWIPMKSESDAKAQV